MKAAYKELDFSAHAVQLLVRRINSEKQANEFLTRIYLLRVNRDISERQIFHD